MEYKEFQEQSENNHKFPQNKFSPDFLTMKISRNDPSNKYIKHIDSHKQ